MTLRRSRCPRPVALGMVRHVPSASDSRRRRLRVALASRADAEGYVLADLFEIDCCGLTEDRAMVDLAETALRLDANAVLVAGDVDLLRLEEIAVRLRLLLLPVAVPPA